MTTHPERDLRAIGVIGSDQSALAIATRLASIGDRRVLVYMTPGAPRPAAQTRVEIVATPTDIAFDCDIVLCAIDDTELFREWLLGTPDRMGFGAEMNPGSVLVDLGVRPPRETHRFLGIIGSRGVALVDAALIGELDAIGRGETIVLAGGYPDAVEGAAKILSRLGRVERTGPLGSAHTAAALMGYMEAAQVIAREEAVTLGRAFGLTPETLGRVLNGDSNPPTANILHLARRTALARLMARDRGVSADVIDLTRAKLARTTPENG